MEEERREECAVVPDECAVLADEPRCMGVIVAAPLLMSSSLSDHKRLPDDEEGDAIASGVTPCSAESVERTKNLEERGAEGGRTIESLEEKVSLVVSDYVPWR